MYSWLFICMMGCVKSRFSVFPLIPSTALPGLPIYLLALGRFLSPLLRWFLTSDCNHINKRLFFS